MLATAWLLVYIKSYCTCTNALQLWCCLRTSNIHERSVSEFVLLWQPSDIVSIYLWLDWAKFCVILRK